MSQNLQGRGLENRRKIWGENTEVDVQVAGDHRSRIAMALNTHFRSECRLDEFLLQFVFGVFQRNRRKGKFKLRQCTGDFFFAGVSPS
jgi:hypothetical protein